MKNKRCIDMISRKLGRTRIIAIVLLVVWGLLIIKAVVFVTTPPVQINTMHYKLQAVPSASGHPPPQYPTVSYVVDLVFQSKGSFSVDNRIHVIARLKQVNTTNLLAFYCCVAFSRASFEPRRYDPDGVEINGWLALKQEALGIYEADGDLVWHVEGDTYMFLAPSGSYDINATTVKKGDHVLHISGLQDTLSIQFNETAERLTWVLVAFSVITLQPILETILVKKKDEKPQ